MSLWSRKPFLAVRILGRHGVYPAFEISTPGHIFVADEHIVWSAVVQAPLPEDWEIGEFTQLMPEEVRLLSAVGLSERDTWEMGQPLITHWAHSHVPLSSVDFDLTAAANRDLASATARALGTGPEQALYEGKLTKYVIRPDLGSHEDAIDLLNNIDSNDQLVLAGLARLLGASRVLFVAGEPEEAAISFLISMEAALEYLRLHLCDTLGTTNVPFAEVSNYLRNTFPHGEEVAEYFELRHDERIMATHPSNRFGEFWTIPLMMGDIYHLRKTLIALYRHLFLGEIPEDGDNERTDERAR
jgi:hypothetical protein